MEQNNKTDQGVSPAGGVPGELPVVGEKKFFTHTMQEDVARAKMDPASFAKEIAAKKPFSEYIPPASAPKEPSLSDRFREPIEDIPSRDQPFPLPETKMEGESAEQPFQIRIPQKRGSANATTIILAVVLLLLVAGGGAAYWWFFMKAPAAPVAVQVPTQKPPTQPQPAPIIPIQPEPEPEIIIIPEPEPVATTTVPVIPPEPVATTTPPIVVTPPPAPVETPEPEAPSPVIALDHTATIELSSLDKAVFLQKLQEENAKITKTTASIRYLVKLTAPTEKKFLTGAETAQLLGASMPADLLKLAGAMEFIGYKSGASFRYGVIATVQNKTSMQTSALAWEKTMLDDLVPLYIQKQYQKPEPVVFSENAYFDFYKRFVNMPQPDVSLDWAVSSRYFVVATSKEMVYAILGKARQPGK